MINVRSLLPTVAGLLLLAAACKDERPACTQPGTVYVRARCYQRKDTVVTDSALRKPVLRPVGAGSDIAFTGSTAQTTLTFTLSPLSDTTRWLLYPDSTRPQLRDTVTFVATRRLQFVSNACGYTYYFSLRNVYSTNVGIDSIRLTNTPEVTNDANVQHLRIYF